MPPFLVVVLEAVARPGVDQHLAVLLLRHAKSRNRRVGLHIEAVEAGAHVELAPVHVEDGDVERHADHERGNAPGLDDVRDETDGLVAKRSIRNQQSQINLQSFELVRNCRRKIVFDFFVAPNSAHERNMEW